jgi:hypothetical protein
MIEVHEVNLIDRTIKSKFKCFPLLHSLKRAEDGKGNQLAGPPGGSCTIWWNGSHGPEAQGCRCNTLAANPGIPQRDGILGKGKNAGKVKPEHISRKWLTYFIDISIS